MFRFLLFALLVALGAASMDEGLKKCHRIFHPGVLKCCTSTPDDTIFRDSVKECDSIPKDPITCDREMCIAKKIGHVTEEGDFDKDKVKEEIEQALAGQPELIDAIKTKCIEGDLAMYGPPDFCDLLKFKMCFRTQMLLKCREWNDAGDCKGVKELAAECEKVLS